MSPKQSATSSARSKRTYKHVTQGMLAVTRERLERAVAVREWWQHKISRPPAGLTGLALSGGGIRSATFSLGLIQALAKSSRDAFSQIDIVSSVSGGGYISCFLRSLFVPDRGRGIDPDVSVSDLRGGKKQFSDPELTDQHEFAKRVLSSGPHERDILWREGTNEAVARRNPLWWLREHSRYLAPNGPTDYGYAIAQIARNWIAMIYIFLLAALAASSAIVLGEVLIRLNLPASLGWTWIPWGMSGAEQLACGRCVPGSPQSAPFSPLFALAAGPALISMILAIAYWMTEAMSPNEASVRRQRRNLTVACGATLLAAGVILFIAERLVPGALKFGMLRKAPPAGLHLIWAIAFGLALTIFGAATALGLALRLRARASELTIELRRRTTKWLANSNQLFLFILVIGLIDTLGAGLASWAAAGGGRLVSGTAAILSPALAFLIKKLPDWFGGAGKSNVFALLQRFLGAVSLIAGLVLYGLLAIGAAALVHSIAWSSDAWRSHPELTSLTLFIGVIWVLAGLAGGSTGFINLSSLHSFYSSRLTRAYLGATNNRRLEAAAGPAPGPGITDSDSADYIQTELYSRADLPAPIHVINTTINETIDPNSQLVARDRKGDVLSVEPGGIQVGRELVEWELVGHKDCAEQLSLGQWCAISGAAASSGMGRLTNLGFALAFTFANVRLGYWWWSPGVCAAGQKPASLPMRLFTLLFGTYIYLANEMTARYSRAYSRKYLTDGGHFENSGAYRLIEHRVPLILVSDNGADPDYRFEDLENLCRMVRLDLGGDMRILGGADLNRVLMKLGSRDRSIFIDSERDKDWRQTMADPASSTFILVLEAWFEDSAINLIWLKPKLLPDLPPDLTGYATSNPPFPQQPTGDQFFDESQWESYRKLGEISMSRLLDACPELLPARGK